MGGLGISCCCVRGACFIEAMHIRGGRFHPVFVGNTLPSAILLFVSALCLGTLSRKAGSINRKRPYLLISICDRCRRRSWFVWARPKETQSGPQVEQLGLREIAMRADGLLRVDQTFYDVIRIVPAVVTLYYFPAVLG